MDLQQEELSLEQHNIPWTANLSQTMIEVLQKMQKHGMLKRYDGGFWSWNNVDLEPLYNGGKLIL